MHLGFSALAKQMKPCPVPADPVRLLGSPVPIKEKANLELSSGAHEERFIENSTGAEMPRRQTSDSEKQANRRSEALEEETARAPGDDKEDEWEVKWCENDTDDPRNMKNWQKWTCTSVVSSASLCVYVIILLESETELC
jgi:hypothetical protein